MPPPMQRLTNKLITIGVLILILVVAGQMVRVLIEERSNTRFEAVDEVSRKWGQAQYIAGPVLRVPYREIIKEKDTITVRSSSLYFLPENLTITGAVDPELRKRGIYKIPVYESTLAVKGFFAPPQWNELNVQTENILWDQAAVVFGLSDFQGIKEAVSLSWNQQKTFFKPGIDGDVPFNGGKGYEAPYSWIHAPVKVEPGLNANRSFEIALDLRGSQGLYFYPLGKETVADLTSSWPHPSFNGAFLPESHTITDDGFSALWKILEFNRNFPQQWRDNPQDLTDSSFGVDFFLPVDVYQQTLRSVKYMALFVALTFLIYFLVEVMNRRRIHPIQYLLVGVGLILFYVLLLSLSEHIPFGAAYLAASGAIVALITAYSRVLFKAARLTMMLGGILAGLYAFLYVLLRLVDYSLLMGSVGLFLILAAVMYVTRNVNWYEEA